MNFEPEVNALGFVIFGEYCAVTAELVCRHGAGNITNHLSWIICGIYVLRFWREHIPLSGKLWLRPGTQGVNDMVSEDEHQALYVDVCRVIGRAVVMLKQSEQPITQQTIGHMLQVHDERTKDLYLTKVYTTAKRVINQKW